MIVSACSCACAHLYMCVCFVQKIAALAPMFAKDGYTLWKNPKKPGVQCDMSNCPQFKIHFTVKI
jgi:hypothetical protein